MSAARRHFRIAGQALTYCKANPGVPYEGSSACTTWPIEDHATVNVRGDEVCVDAIITHLETVSHSDREEETSFTSDPGGDLRPAQSQPIAGEQRKVGSCYSPSTNQSKEVWNTVYQGCVPNQTATGTPVLTAKSTYLDAFGVHGWKFAAAPTAPAPAPAPQASR